MNVSRLAAPAVLLLGFAAYMALRPGPEERPAVEPNSEASVEGTREPIAELRSADSENISYSTDDSTQEPPSAPSQEAQDVAGDQPSQPKPPGADTIPTPPDERELRRIDFREQHSASNVPELRSERDALQTRIDEVKQAAIEQRFSQNDFDIEFPGGPPRPPAPLGPGGHQLLTEVRTSVDPDTLQISAQIVVLPFDEYPELYALLDQSKWLTELIGD